MNNKTIPGILGSFYQQFNEYTIWLKDQVANNKAISLMWKNGFEIQTKDEILNKFFKKFVTQNKLIQHLHEIERVCSMWGVAIVTINTTKTGDMKLVVCDPWYNNELKSRFDEEVGAVVYKRIDHSNFSFQIRETWTATEVTRVGVGVSNGEEKEIPMGDINVKLPLDLQLPEKEVHNLGFVPVVMFSNKPNITLFGTNNIISWITNADDYGAYKLQCDFEHTLRAASLEVQNNRTRVFGNFSPIDIDGYQQQPYQNPLLKTQWLKNAQSLGGTAPNTISPLIQTIQGDPKFSAYNERLNWIKKEYYEACGYTVAAEGSGSKVGGDKTATEIQFQSSLDANTTHKKRCVRQVDLNRLMRKVVAAAGLGYDYKEMEVDAPFTFVINNAVVANMSPQQALDIYKVKKELGVFSPVEYFQEMHGMSREEAEEKARQIIKDQDEFGRDEQEVEGQEDNNKENKVENQENNLKKEEKEE